MEVNYLMSLLGRYTSYTVEVYPFLCRKYYMYCMRVDSIDKVWEREHAKLVLPHSWPWMDQETTQVGKVGVVRRALKDRWWCSTLQISMKTFEGLLNCFLFVTGTNNGIYENSVRNQVLAHGAMAETAKATEKARC